MGDAPRFGPVSRLIQLLLLCVALPAGVTAIVVAAELRDSAVQAFSEHAEQAQQAFVSRVHAAVGQQPRDVAELRAGEVVARPGSGDGILDVGSGLVHDWRAQVLIPGVRLDQVLRLSRSYPDYPAIFHPVVAARIVSHDGDRYRIQLRMHESTGGLSATLDVNSSVVYTRLDARHAFVISRSEEIREVRHAGRPSESLLPVGKDSGYLWRARAMTRFVEDEAGVWMEMETLGLSRPFPPVLGLVIEPIARRIGRRSAEASLAEFRRAVLTRSVQNSR